MTEADHVEMVRLLRRRWMLLRRSLPLAVLGALLAVESVAVGVPGLAYVGLATIATGALPVVLQPVWARRDFRRSPGAWAPIEMRLSEEGIDRRSGGSTVRISWYGVPRIVDGDRCYLVRLPRTAFVVPKRAATGADAATLRAWFEPYIAGNLRVVAAPPAPTPPTGTPAPLEPVPGGVVLRWQPEAADQVEWQRLWMRHARQRLKTAALIAGLLLLGTVTLLLRWPWPIAYLSGVVALSALVNLLRLPAHARRRFRRDPVARLPVEVRVSAVGLDIRRAISSAVVPWTRISRVAEGERLYVAVLAGRHRSSAGLLLAKRGAGDQADALRELLAPYLSEAGTP